VLTGELTIREAAKILDVTEDAVRQYIKRLETKALGIDEDVFEKMESDDPLERLEAIAKLLEKRVREVLIKGQVSGSLANLIRELRALIKDVRELGAQRGEYQAELLKCRQRYDALWQAVVRNIRDPELVEKIAEEVKDAV